MDSLDPSKSQPSLVHDDLQNNKHKFTFFFSFFRRSVYERERDVPAAPERPRRWIREADLQVDSRRA